MTDQATARSMPDTLDVPHLWACHVEGFHFTYLYGTARECDRLRERLGEGVLRKGVAPTREAARQRAEEQARATAEFYADLGGRVRVVAMAAFAALARNRGA